MSSSSSTIYVGNLPSHIDESSLASFFSPFGDILSISVPTTSAPGGKRNKGFGFITFSSPDDALDALDNMHLNAIQGRTILVNLADPNKIAKEGKGGPNRAVWDNEEWLKQYDASDQDPAAANPEEAQQDQGAS